MKPIIAYVNGSEKPADPAEVAALMMDEKAIIEKAVTDQAAIYYIQIPVEE